MDTAQLWLHFDTALLPDGWSNGVRIGIGRRAASRRFERDAAAQSGDTQRGIGLPGMANLHSHAFQRGMAGLAEQRGRGTGQFLDLARDHVPFRGADRTRRLRGNRRAGFRRDGRSGFHACRRIPLPAQRYRRAPLRQSRRDGVTGCGGCGHVRHCAHAAAGVSTRMAGSAVRRCRTGRSGSPIRSKVTRVCSMPAAPPSRDCTMPSSASRRTAFVPRHRTSCVHSFRLRGDAPIHIHIAEQMREVEECLVWSGARPVAWLLDHAAVDRRWCSGACNAYGTPARRQASCPPAEPWLGCVRSRRPILATVCSTDPAYMTVGRSHRDWHRLQCSH